MNNKIKYLMIGLVFVITISQFASAYSYSGIFNLDQSGWDYEKYFCGYSQESCDSPSSLQNSGENYPSKLISFYSNDFNKHYAVWFFQKCHRPQAWWWYGSYYTAPTFDQKENGTSTFNSLTISDSTPDEGDILDVDADINSAFTVADDDAGTPNYYPDSHRDWYTSDITVSAVVKNYSHTTVMILPSQTIPIYQDESESLTFEVNTTGLGAGTYTVYVTTQCSDCICDQSNDIPVTESVSFTIEEEEYECYSNADCGTDGYIGNNYCSSNDVYRDYREFICNNPGCSSYCSYDDDSIFQEDCGEDQIVTSEDYCVGNDVYYDKTTIDRGCSSGSCFENPNTQQMFVEECDYSCFQGECVGECEDDSDCDDGLYCNGEEFCEGGVCESGTAVDCSYYDINPVNTCFFDPDNNPFTFDFFAGFDSECNEATDSCTTNLCWQNDMTHECDISCGAECETDADCTNGQNGVCLENCSCEYDDGQERCGPDNEGILYEGYCWYEGDEYYQNCDEICGNHSSVCIQPPVQDDCSLHAYLGIDCNPHWCVGDGLFAPAWQWECNNCYYNSAGNYSCSTSGNYYRICACEVGEEECGNDNLDAGEECDDGSDNGIVCSPEYEGSCDYCSESCDLITLNGGYCGDGILNVQYEECDDGNTQNNDGCSSACNIEDDDDDDNHKNGKGSSITYLGYDEEENLGKSSYSLSFCGDNVTQTTEECDDGNYVNGDGCSSVCEFEKSNEKESLQLSGIIFWALIFGIIILLLLVIVIGLAKD